MTTRTITGTVKHDDGTAWAGGAVTFHLVAPFQNGDGTYPADVVSFTLSAGGALSAAVAVPSTGTAAYDVTMPDGWVYRCNLAAGPATDLQTLLALSGSPVSPDAAQTAIDAHDSNPDAHAGTFDPAGTGTSAAEAAVTAHVAQTDPHPGKYDASGAASAAIIAHDDDASAHAGTFDASGAAVSAVAGHVAAVDPHTQYINDPRFGARLDSFGVFPVVDVDVDPYLVRDLFVTDLAAGDVAGTIAEPGPAARVVVDSEDKLSITGGMLNSSGYVAAPGWGDPTIGLNQAIYRKSGRTFFFQIKSSDAVPDVLAGLYDTLPSLSNLAHGIQFGSYNNTIYYRCSTSPYVCGVGILEANVTYTFAVTMRNAGCYLFIKGGAYTTWTLLYVDNANAFWGYVTAAFYLFVGSIGAFKVMDLPEPFTDDHGIATAFIPLPVAGSTFVHLADCMIEFTVSTLNSAGEMALQFRKQDASNYWKIAIASDASGALVEVVDGTPTTRGTIPATLIPSGSRVVVSAIGQTIMVMVNNSLLVYYGAAANFVTATAGELDAVGTGGVVKNIIAYPGTYGSAALPVATRNIPVADIVDVADYGADETGTVDSTSAFQAAIDSGAYVKISTSGTYLLSHKLVIPSNRAIIGTVAGVILKKASAYSHVFVNSQASTKGAVWNSNITIRNLTIDDDDSFTGGDAADSNLNGLLSFRYLRGLTLDKITIINGDATSYAIHLVAVQSAAITDYSYTGLKDAMHISGGCSDILIDGFTITAGDDTFAILAQGWDLDQSNAWDIRNIIIRNGTTDCGTAPGFLLRLITGSWLPWQSGNSYKKGDIANYGGRIYKKVNAGSAISTTPPTHAWGDMTLNSIQWRWIGNGSNTRNGIYNVSLTDVTILDNRVIIRMVEDDTYNRSEYPGTEGTSIVDGFVTDLPITIFTNQGGVFSNATWGS